MRRYRIVPDALSASLSDGAVLLHLYSKRYYSLNDTGTRVWELLRQEASDGEIVETLTREYDVDAADAERAVRLLLEELLAEHLIEAVPS